MVAIVSFLAPLVGEGLGFLRILRTLRLLHTYELTARLRADGSPFFRRNEEIVNAVTNSLFSLHYGGYGLRNPALAQSGDIQLCRRTLFHRDGAHDHRLRRHHLEGVWGRLISIIIMIFGVTMFLRHRRSGLTRFVLHAQLAGCSVTK